MINRESLFKRVEVDMETPIDEDVLTIKKAIEAAGFEAFLVGGAVRDILMGIYPLDWDMTTSATPDDICEIFKALSLDLGGISQGTVKVGTKSTTVEITTYREDYCYEDSRHPGKVIFIKDIEKDMTRRDFTVNAMAMDIRNGKLYLFDPFGGREDIRYKRLRSVGSSYAKFEEDALRIWRALRFESVLGFIPDEEMKDALNESGNFLDVSEARVKAEMDKLLMGNYLKEALETGFGIILLRFCKIIDDSWEKNEKLNPWNGGDIKAYENFQMKLPAIMERVPVDKNLRWAVLIYNVMRFLQTPENAEELKEFIFERLNIVLNKVPFTRNEKRIIEAYVMFYIKINGSKSEDFSYMPIISRKQLDIDYEDLKEIGITGSDAGLVFNNLIEALQEGKINNDRDDLIKAAINMHKYN